MTPDELHTHIETVRRLKTDTDTLEAKSAVGGLPQNLWRSLSAFSNTRGGSVVLGIEEMTGNVVGVKNAARMQHELGCMCADMDPSIRPRIQSHRIEGHMVVTAEVPEIDKQVKPCYYKSS